MHNNPFVRPRAPGILPVIEEVCMHDQGSPPAALAVSLGEALRIAGRSPENSTQKSRSAMARMLICRKKYPFEYLQLPGSKHRVVTLQTIEKALGLAPPDPAPESPPAAHEKRRGRPPNTTRKSQR